jgi:hypothetical protein
LVFHDENEIGRNRPVVNFWSTQRADGKLDARGAPHWAVLQGCASRVRPVRPVV